MSTFIAAAIGAVLAGVALIGGVNAYSGAGYDPVSSQDLYTYADQ